MAFGETLARIWAARGLAVDSASATAADALIRAGVSAWPELSIDPEALERFIAERAGPQDLDAARAADWAIASECARGTPKALALFEARFIAAVAPSLRKLRLSPADLDAAVQRLRTDLLVSAPDRPAGITRYEGRGELLGWLRVSAVRAGLKAARSGAVDAARLDDDQLGERIAGGADDPELSYIKATYREHFRASFSEALAGLDAEERTLLKQSLLDGMSIDALARVYGVHRATAARRVASAREHLVGLTRERFQGRVNVGPRECESIFRAMGSQLDVTFRRLSA
jgi:RNA polymerase sigma-70 factor, ECF subfamily